MRVRIGEVMVNHGLLTQDQVNSIIEHQKQRPRPFGELAEVLFHVSSEDVEAAWVEQYSLITEHVDRWDALVAAWLPGSEGDGVSDVLLGREPFTGTLPYTWPRHASDLGLSDQAPDPLFPYDFGLTTG